MNDVPQLDVDGKYYITNSADIQIYVKTTDGGTVKSLYAVAGVSSYAWNTWQTGEITRDVVLPKGSHVIYANCRYRLQKGTTNNAAVKWSGFTSSFVYDYYHSRIFANGLVFGSSQNNFFSVLRDTSGDINVKSVTSNGKLGFELLSSGLSDIAGGIRLRKTVVLGFGYVLCRVSGNTYYDTVYGTHAVRGNASFACSRIAAGVHQLTFPTTWSNVVTSARSLFVTAIGYNDTTNNGKSENNVNTTVTVKSVTTTDCVIVVGDDMSPNDLFGFYFKIEYMLD